MMLKEIHTKINQTGWGGKGKNETDHCCSMDFTQNDFNTPIFLSLTYTFGSLVCIFGSVHISNQLGIFRFANPVTEPECSKDLPQFRRQICLENMPNAKIKL